MLDLARALVRGGRPHELVHVKDAKAAYAAFRSLHGAKRVATPLLTAPGDNAKFNKTGVVTYGLSLAQADSSGVVNTCHYYSKECKRGCVSFAGKGELATVQGGRIRKTLFLHEHPSEFFTLLVHELEKVWVTHGIDCLVRLNTFSDIPWEEIKIISPEVTVEQRRDATSIFGMFPRMRFYDYTKWALRAMDANLGAFEWPGNYRLIMSASEKTSDEALIKAVHQGVNYAVLFDVRRGQPLPAMWKGVHVIDGDAQDARWYDAKYSVIGLRAKGRMRKGDWRMVRHVEEET